MTNEKFKAPLINAFGKWIQSKSKLLGDECGVAFFFQGVGMDLLDTCQR